MGCDWSMCGNLNIWDVFWMLGTCSLSVLVLHEILLVPVLMYGREIMLWNEKERCRIRTAQVDNLRGLLGIRRMDRVLNVRIRELCGVTKGLMKVFFGDSAM